MIRFVLLNEIKEFSKYFSSCMFCFLSWYFLFTVSKNKLTSMAKFSLDSNSPDIPNECNINKSSMLCSTLWFGNFSASSLQIVNPRLTEESYRYWHTQNLFMVGAYDLEKHYTCLIIFLSCSFYIGEKWFRNLYR